MANHIVWEAHGLVHYFSGVLTGTELLAAIETAHADPRFDGAKYAISDFTGCTGLLLSDVEPELISAIAGAAALSRNKFSRSAFVISNPNFFEHFDQFIESPLSPPDTRRFSTLDEAKQWAITR